MDIRKTIELLKQKSKEAVYIASLPYNNHEYLPWRRNIEDILETAFGITSTEYTRVANRRLKVRGTSREIQQGYVRYIQRIQLEVNSIIQKYEVLGMKKTPASEKPIKEDKPKAFIAHEGETRALSMLKEYLEALGILYLIAEAKASDGRSIEGQVNWTQGEADFAICLATKGKAINKKTGKHYMAPNIADELGRARQVFGNKIILLVQKGVDVHTNTREIVNETFTTTNMERAFIKIAKELTNWEFIAAKATIEHSSEDDEAPVARLV